VSLFRRALRFSLYPFAKTISYQGDIPGYRGWIEVFGFLVAFVRDDGTEQYAW